MERGVLTSPFTADILQTARNVPILFFLLKSPAKASLFKLIHYICIIPKQD